nr:plasmid pRiA4b ORF-3 family protein [Sinorhizobium meliloti]
MTLDDVEPLVMRRVVVPFRIRFDRLHEVLQAAYGWSNSHLYEFRIRDVGFGIPDGGFDDPIDARKATLLSAIEDIGARSFKYLYDFGDGWTHTVKIEKTFPVIADLNDPFLLDAVGRCPPEDVGGPWGYEEFREALANKNHERHDELVEWWGSADRLRSRRNRCRQPSEQRRCASHQVETSFTQKSLNRRPSPNAYDEAVRIEAAPEKSEEFLINMQVKALGNV